VCSSDKKKAKVNKGEAIPANSESLALAKADYKKATLPNPKLQI
jgi:hypothetical protein